MSCSSGGREDPTGKFFEGGRIMRVGERGCQETRKVWGVEGRAEAA